MEEVIKVQHACAPVQKTKSFGHGAERIRGKLTASPLSKGRLRGILNCTKNHSSFEEALP
jgi:hypothetical protein